MGSIDVISQIIVCLESGQYRHAYRSDMAAKNLLYSGVLDVSFVIKLLHDKNLKYDSSPHDQISNVTVDICRIRRGGVDWYIKTYFEYVDEFSTVIISVHD